MQIAKKYSPKEVETRRYQEWLEHRCFESQPDDRKPYTVVIPPPNVTGILHMGHMLNNTIQDILVRKARLDGKNACWVPGTDHASIATEAKVVNRLKEQGRDKYGIGREAFLKEAWQWTHEHGGIILEQLKKLGCSCDWSRTKFTLDQDMSASVQKVFIELFNKGLIYRGYRILNWDPEALTNISDEEVIYQEKESKLFYLKYDLKDSDGHLSIATTRPETIFGDIAVAVNPKDERYQHLIGGKVIVPLCGREVPIIADDYVDLEFGTGCLKVTPAHDKNDFEIGERHDLEIINVLDEKGFLNEFGGEFRGLERFVARKKVVQVMEERGLLLKTESTMNKVGTSERTGAVIEPRPSVQWFVRMDRLAKPALHAVRNGDLKLYPDYFKNTYYHWLENIKDWNISRQLWWGHRIPAFYYGSGQDDFVVAETPERAARIASEKSGKPITVKDLRQDEDVLDTWFSSWLWPISVFNGILEPDNDQIQYYYPTNDLITGPDIIFFWVARMVMAGLEFRGELPFKNVYFTGIVRDKQRRKMSKQLGNSPDALKLIEDFGADGVRVGLLMSSSAGNDLLFDEKLCLQGRNFANKLWNSFRLLKSWEIEENGEIGPDEKSMLNWMNARIDETLQQLEKNYAQFRLSDSLTALYKLVWDDYCSWFLEAVKPVDGRVSNAMYNELTAILERILIMLHPFMPFITEEIWQMATPRQEGDFLMKQAYPTPSNIQIRTEVFAHVQNLISEVRNIRNKNGLSPKVSLELQVKGKLPDYHAIVSKLANVEIKEELSEYSRSSAQVFLVDKSEYAIYHEDFEHGQRVDIDEVRAQIEYLEGFKKSVERKLNNQKFVANAPEQVVEKERNKLKDAEVKIAKLKSQLESTMT